MAGIAEIVIQVCSPHSVQNSGGSIFRTSSIRYLDFIVFSLHCSEPSVCLEHRKIDRISVGKIVGEVISISLDVGTGTFAQDVLL